MLQLPEVFCATCSVISFGSKIEREEVQTMTEYIVAQGDTLSGIARRHGVRYWQNIYLAARNEAFRNQQPAPNRISSGDRIHIPDRTTIFPMERHPSLVHRDIPLFTQSAETCWRATGRMLYRRKYPRVREGHFDTLIGDRYRTLEKGLGSELWRDFYVRVLGMTETIIVSPNDLHRLLATRGPVIAAIGDGNSAHSMVVAGYDILRGRWLVLDPAAGEVMTFADEVIDVGGNRATVNSGVTRLDEYHTGPATWENMARWLWIFDTTIHQRIVHY
jgi:hypothetical protein